MTKSFRLNNKKILLTYPKLDVRPIFFQECFVTMCKTYAITIKYMCISSEDHNQTEGKHIHCYVEFERAFQTRDERCFDVGTYHPNIEVVTKTPHKTVAYVMKDGDYIEYREENRPVCPFNKMTKREKNEWFKTHDILEAVNEGAISLLSLRSLQQNINIYNDLARKKDVRLKLTVKWYYGETGTGKTRTAIEECLKEYGDYWKWNGTFQWFDGYNAHKAVIIDDFRRQDVKFNFMLQLFDIYPMKVPIKGGFVDWVPELIIVTCPVDSREAWQWYDKDGEVQDWDCIEQLERRITEHKLFEK